MAEDNGKSAKGLSLANCGMGAAVDIGVMREHVLGFLSMSLAQRLRFWETDLFMRALVAIGLRAAAEAVPEHRTIFVGEFALGRR
jgi:hypothetical protein